MKTIYLTCTKCEGEIEIHKLPLTWRVNNKMKYTLRCPFCEIFLGHIIPKDLEELFELYKVQNLR